MNNLIDNLSQKAQQHSNYREENNDLKHSCIMIWEKVVFLTWPLGFLRKRTEINPGTKHKNPILWDRNQFGRHENVPPAQEGKIRYIL